LFLAFMMMMIMMMTCKLYSVISMLQCSKRVYVRLGTFLLDTIFIGLRGL
jgi:hypothetical protein